MRSFISQRGTPRRRFLRREFHRAPRIAYVTTRLTMRWTVDQSLDPNLCALGHVEAIDITLSTTTGVLIGQFRAPCLAFATTIPALPPGDYVADAVLVDAMGRPRTTMIAIHPFALLERSELVIDVDFPADSFLDDFDRETIRLVSESGERPRGSGIFGGEGDEPDHASLDIESSETR